MDWKITLGLFFVLWWVLLFAVLPWGIRSQHETGNVTPGTDPGAPVQPMLLKKALWTTLITMLAVALIYVLVTYRVIPL